MIDEDNLEFSFTPTYEQEDVCKATAGRIEKLRGKRDWDWRNAFQGRRGKLKAIYTERWVTFLFEANSLQDIDWRKGNVQTIWRDFHANACEKIEYKPEKKQLICETADKRYYFENLEPLDGYTQDEMAELIEHIRQSVL